MEISSGQHSFRGYTQGTVAQAEGFSVIRAALVAAEGGELRDKTIRANRFVRALLQRPGVVRSGHPTHEWLALGRDARDMASGHGFMEAPFGENAPLRKALEHGASMLCIGCAAEDHPVFKSAASGEDRLVFKYLDVDGKQKIGFQEKPAVDAVFGGRVCSVPFEMAMLTRIDF